MKKGLLSLLLIGFAMQAEAQTFVKSAIVPVATPQKNTLSPDPVAPGVAAPSMATSRGEEIQLGSTSFDLQTYNSMPHRIGTDADGLVSAIWMSGFTSAGWPDRGTSAAWQDVSGEFSEGVRIEDAAIRTGFPTATVLGNGTQVAIAHRTTNAPPYSLQMNRRAAGESSWTVSDVPSLIAGGPLWPCMAAGGPDGNTIHLVSIHDVPTTDRNLLYHRSLDGGDTWDVVDVLLPGMEDTTLYRSIDAQAYNISARGNTVAIAVFAGWGDVRMYKSEDNGDSWTYKTVIDFPLDGYIANTGYDSLDIPHRFEAAGIDPYAIFTNDGSGDVGIGPGGKVHVTFGQMYVVDSDLTDAGTSIYGSVSGLMYWNEDMPEDTCIYIADLWDTTGDTLFGTASSTFAVYFQNNVTGHPGMAIDNDGNMYVVYQSPVDELVNVTTNVHYNHIHLVKSTDGGATWSDPYDLINPILADPDGFMIEETVYPSIACSPDGNLHISYQMDYSINAFVNDATIPVSDNYMIYLGLTPNLDIISRVEIPISTPSAMRILPNITQGSAVTSIKATSSSVGQLSVLNSFGQQVAAQSVSVVAGENTLPLDLSGLPSGSYRVQFVAEKMNFSATVVVQK